jgi:hypothetical protein
MKKRQACAGVQLTPILKATTCVRCKPGLSLEYLPNSSIVRGGNEAFSDTHESEGIAHSKVWSASQSKLSKVLSGILEQ